MAVINASIFSMYLSHEMDITVVLPDDINENEKLKCVWLYHGGSGDHMDWIFHTRLTDYVNDRRFAAVLPTVHESCFVDMNIGNRYGKYVGRELPRTVWNMFKCISDRRQDNYVSGFSNGGYGCLHTVLMYPDKFSKAGAFSAGDKADADFPNDGGAKSIARIRLYGDGDLHKNEYGITYLADRIIDDINSGKRSREDVPQIYHACGDKDPWLNMNHILRDYFTKNSDYFDYTYDEMKGLGHEWDFWEEELVRFLDFAGLKTI